MSDEHTQQIAAHRAVLGLLIYWLGKQDIIIPDEVRKLFMSMADDFEAKGAASTATELRDVTEMFKHGLPPELTLIKGGKPDE